MIFIQTNLKVKQTSADIIKLSITSNIRALLTVNIQKWTCGQNPHYNYTGYAIASQDAEVFIKGNKLY